MTFLKKIDINSIFKNKLELGNIIFLFGIFFLPSAFPLGALFLLISIVISLIQNKENLLKNKFNFVFFICILIIFISTFYNIILNRVDEILDSQSSIILLNLFNWIPIYFAFLGFQIYLKNEEQRITFQRFLIAGSIPVIASCIMHKFLNIYGPFETLFGTIVWFNYESVLGSNLSGDIGGGGVSGLFNNPNYLGMWLTLCLPFSLSLLRSERIKSHKIILFIINFLIIYFTILTNSRNAFLGLLVCLLLTFGIKRLLYFSLFIFLGIFLFNFLIPNFINLSDSYLVDKFFSIDLNFNYPRIKIWTRSIFLIFQKPFLGWGSGSMPYITMFFPPYQNYQHTHNMILELAYNFGIPLSLLVFSTILKVLQESYQKINKLKKSLLNHSTSKSFIIAFLIFLFSHLNDITYYDGKISILFSILLASLIKIIDQQNHIEEEKYQIKK